MKLTPVNKCGNLISVPAGSGLYQLDQDALLERAAPRMGSSKGSSSRSAEIQGGSWPEAAAAAQLCGRWRAARKCGCLLLHRLLEDMQRSGSCCVAVQEVAGSASMWLPFPASAFGDPCEAAAAAEQLSRRWLAAQTCGCLLQHPHVDDMLTTLRSSSGCSAWTYRRWLAGRRVAASSGICICELCGAAAAAE
jgi:hypothetical protein